MTCKKLFQQYLKTHCSSTTWIINSKNSSLQNIFTFETMPGESESVKEREVTNRIKRMNRLQFSVIVKFRAAPWRTADIFELWPDKCFLLPNRTLLLLTDNDLEFWPGNCFLPAFLTGKCFLLGFLMSKFFWLSPLSIAWPLVANKTAFVFSFLALKSYRDKYMKPKF